MADGVSNDFGLVARMLSDGFNRIDHRLDELNRRLDGKADIAAVAALEQTLATHKIEVDKRFRPLEDGAIVSAASSRAKIWFGNAVVLVIASSIGAFLYYIASLGGHP